MTGQFINSQSHHITSALHMFASRRKRYPILSVSSMKQGGAPGFVFLKNHFNVVTKYKSFDLKGETLNFYLCSTTQCDVLLT